MEKYKSPDLHFLLLIHVLGYNPYILIKCQIAFSPPLGTILAFFLMYEIKLERRQFLGLQPKNE